MCPSSPLQVEDMGVTITFRRSTYAEVLAMSGEEREAATVSALKYVQERSELLEEVHALFIVCCLSFLLHAWWALLERRLHHRFSVRNVRVQTPPAWVPVHL